MLVLTLVNWLFGLKLKNLKEYQPRKKFMILATAVNILYLLYFKEAYFLLDWINNVFPSFFSENTFLKLLSITAVAPLGVSYYVFKCCSYIFDVYMGKIQPCSSPIDVILYVTFFPQVFSGPIVNATDFFESLDVSLTRDHKSYSFLEFDKASLLIMLGIFKKSIIATILSLLIVAPVFALPMNYNTIELLFAAFAYSIVIYADFSGYSDIAIGVALLLGFNTKPNFNHPYTATNITDFWRRWHISFSSWLRDYVYFSFGGSRFGSLRTMAALFFTMVIAGLWHGFKFTFIIWGALHGATLCLERFFILKNNEKEVPQVEFLFKDKIQDTAQNLKLNFNFLHKGLKPSSENTNSKNSDLSNTAKKKILYSKYRKIFLNVALTFLFVTFSWLFFRAENLSEVGLYFTSLKNFTIPFKVLNPFCFVLFMLGLGLQFIPENFCKKGFVFYSKIPLVFKALVLALTFVAMQLITTSGIPEFIYFKF